MLPDYLVPLALVFGIAMLLPRSWVSGRTPRNMAVVALFLAVAGVAWRYLQWRLGETLPEPGTAIGEQVFFYTVLAIELAVWVETAILFAMLSRRRDNSAAADAGEARLRALAPADHPTVDVFIATYNEDLAVLEKTIVGAAALDWPEDRLRVCVLDDGQRDWLRDYCATKGVDYLTREGNAHAKAGNINAAIARTDGEFFMVLDADFVPQQNFLYRAMGLFADEKVGIVQIPHSFYNADPMQTNLGMRGQMPDDQRLFFGEIMAGRDGWNAAFCCGSNSITRRKAIEAVGGGLPYGSITEDMLLTLAMLRKGYVTRYLNERLAIGLAPESLSAMYVQRARWARGAMQILFLREGPFGPGLKLQHRILFLPTHWLVQPLVVLATLGMPAICLWTGWSPLPGATTEEILSVQLPAVAATMLALRLVAPGSYFPLASTVHTALQTPRTLPTVLTTLVRPHGHAFKVTPKGKAAGNATDRLMSLAPSALVLVTAIGLYLNSDINTRILDTADQLSLTAVWAVLAMLVLSVVQVVAMSPPGEIEEEKFAVDVPCMFGTRPGQRIAATIAHLSVDSATLRLADATDMHRNTRWLRLDIPEVGALKAWLQRVDGNVAHVAFDLPEGERRDQLIRALFTTGLDNSTQTLSAFRVGLGLLARILHTERRIETLRRPKNAPPAWIEVEVARAPIPPELRDAIIRPAAAWTQVAWMLNGMTLIDPATLEGSVEA
ncbi:cellulose synthase (UDP-forming) [Palleronia salina]|uniref:Cellulose synthase (UDP-forming) n=1 Tax=Palleronia salina TaxID=313368 RepID=A0A1M6ETZ9_9RHOB|nr:glycosyltransferase [Palleronia salina]SHI88893.1 cellulose synthase (UDP-forming) [Palleronia salina]